MKNVEKKELLEVLDGFVKNDRKKELLQLIENGIVDERMCQSQHYYIREELAKHGYFVDVLIGDKDEFIRYQAYKWLIENNKIKQQHHIDYAIQQDDVDVLYLFIKNKIIDKRMCQSKHWEVREELARNGYFIDILIKDEHIIVSVEAYKWLIKNFKLEQHHIDYAIQKDDKEILLFLIKHKIIDEKMCQSEHGLIREILASEGYFIDVLINDKNGDIRYDLYEWLIINKKLEQKHIDKFLFNKDYEILQFLVNSNYENDLIDKDRLSQKIKEFQARNEDNISLLINNKDIFKNNS